MNNKHLLRVGIYERLSNEDTDKSNKGDVSESIKNQHNLLINEINKRKDFILVDEYCDEDLSGAGTYRPEFERLIKDCKNGKIDIVLCKSQSRFSRDMEIIEKYIHNKFIEWNVRFIGICDNADTLNKGNKKSRQINGLVNEWYLEDVSNNIRSAFNTKMKQGEFISPFASFGYNIDKNNNNKLVIDPYASEIVKDIYNLFLNGFGYTKIANYLNKKNVPSPSLYKKQKGIKLNIVSNKPIETIKWNPNSIKIILTNELYIGNLIQGKRTTVNYKNHKIIKKNKNEWIKVKNTHEPIIDNKLFFMVQESIKQRTKPIKKTGIIHIFSGKVYCNICKCLMRKKNSSKHEYLVCSNKECINKKSIRYDELANIIKETINNLINKYYDEIIIRNLYKNNNYNREINNLIKQKYYLEKQIEYSNIYLSNIYEDKTNGTINKLQFDYLSNKYNKNINSYIEQIKYLNKKIINYNNKTEYKKINLIFSNINRIIIQEFIDRIFIDIININDKSRSIYIKWNF